MIGRPPRPKEEVRADLLWQLANNWKLNKKTGCREWTGALWASGYARFTRHHSRGGLHSRVHRAVYELKYGKLPSDMYVCHTCDNRRCIEITHLWAGTNQENQLDASAKGVFARYWTPENRAKYSRMYSGAGNPMYGKPSPDSIRFTGRKHTEESKRKISESLKRGRYAK